MAVTAAIYNNAPNQIAKGGIPDLTNATTTIKVALMESPFAFDATDVHWGDIKADECDSVDYTAGGVELTNKTIATVGGVTTFSTSNDPNKTIFTTDGSIIATHAVIYLATGTDATSYLIACTDFDGAKESSVGEFSLIWDAQGIFAFEVAV